jgi:hypothetical protein
MRWYSSTTTRWNWTRSNRHSPPSRACRFRARIQPGCGIFSANCATSSESRRFWKKTGSGAPVYGLPPSCGKWSTRPVRRNQFNLNGLRTTEGEWRRLLENPGSLALAVSYHDKFGPLGKIAVLAGDRVGQSIRVSHWVMSCGAFSRGIEFPMLESLFRQSNAEEIEFAFRATERNQPLREFFGIFGVPLDSSENFRLTRSRFSAHSGLLPHQVSELIQ